MAVLRLRRWRRIKPLNWMNAPAMFVNWEEASSHGSSPTRRGKLSIQIHEILSDVGHDMSSPGLEKDESKHLRGISREYRRHMRRDGVGRARVSNRYRAC